MPWRDGACLLVVDVDRVRGRASRSASGEHRGVGVGVDVVERVRLGEGERADAQRAAARRDARSRRARRRDRRRASGRRCRSRTRRARSPPGTARVRTPRRSKRSTWTATRRALDVVARARELVEPATADLHRRHHRRELLDVADEARRRALRPRRASAASAAGRRPRPTRRACSSRCRTRSARGTPCRASWRNRSRRVRAPEADEQHAGGVGIERARVPDPALPVDLAQLGDDVVRRAARRLVDDDEPVAHRRSVASRALRGQSASRMRGDDRRDVERRLEAGGEAVPAAAVVGGDARGRRRHRASAGSPGRCRRALPSRTQVTSASVVRRRMSMSPSTSSSVTSWRSSMSWVTAVHTKRRSTSSSRVRQRLAEQLEVREAVLLEELARQARDRDVELDELAREVEHRRRGGVVLEAAGVADQRGVQRTPRRRRSSGRPSSSTSRRTSTPLAAASGSITLMVP